MRWKPIGNTNTPITKFEVQGHEVMGLYHGTRDGKYGPLGVIETDDGEEIIFPLHTMLQSRLEDVNPGTTIRIVYLGYATSPKTNRQYKNFSVFIADDNEEEGEGND